MTSNQLVAIANVFHANILNVSSTDMIVELTGTPSTLDSFVECCKPYHIVKIYVRVLWQWKNNSSNKTEHCKRENDDMLTLDKIYHAAYVLRDVVRKTDLILAPHLNPIANCI